MQGTPGQEVGRRWECVPGSKSCLDDGGIKMTKPENLLLNTWRSLRIVDSRGAELVCDLNPDEQLLTIPEACTKYEDGKRTTYISFTEGKVTYKVTCNDHQADYSYEPTDPPAPDAPVIDCGKDFIMARVSRSLPGFSDEVAVTPVSWTLGIYNGFGTSAPLIKVNMTRARAYGYVLTSNEDYLMVKANFNATGIHELAVGGQKFYNGNIVLLQERRNPKIAIDVKIICARGPFPCNKTHMNILIPPFDGTLQAIIVDDAEMASSDAVQLGTRGLTVTVDIRSGTKLAIAANKLKPQTGNQVCSFSALTLVFVVDDLSVPMRLTPDCSCVPPDELTPECSCVSHDPPLVTCTEDGFMIVEVRAIQTTPILDLDTVYLGKGQCRPQEKTDISVKFTIRLTDCGTTARLIDGKIYYENEIRALWKDFPRFISRDSELRETVRCIYNASADGLLKVNVLTQSPPPVSDRFDGPLTLVLNIYQDVSYNELYRDDQYPVVKTLRDPIFLEVQVLNRNDPNIELVLNDCWATMSPDSTTSPQWNVVVDGCQENRDDYLTVFHPVSNVALPKHRKRFEVKAFAFMVGEDLSPDLVYFHCSAIICNIQDPDFPLCTKNCPLSRRKRHELFLHRHSLIASKGPVFFEDSVQVMNAEGERSVIGDITLGILPAFGLVGLIALVAAIVSFNKWRSQS
ncbi:zona pellucida sperm-binding protein 2 isoform X2 [Hyperolius riggenbachi]|uniref:zona pellucida sperm-binding protein 2 isoform X2 n=1 Tax=Hyperolius riggenbachi TaxID=752182 RepID=UPI0035A30D25